MPSPEDVELALQSQIKQELERIETKNPEINSEVKTSEEVQSSTSEVEKKDDPFEAEARKMGWTPEYKGPNKKSAEQFVKDGSYFKKIDAQKKEIEDLKKLFRESEERYLKFEKAKKEQIIAELQQKKLQAVEEGDSVSYGKVENQLKIEFDELSQLDKPINPPVSQETPEEVKTFIERNKDWMNINTPENELMAKTADGLCAVVAEEARLNGETIDITEQLSRVEERIKILFPKRFENKNKEKPAMVATSTVSSGERTKSLSNRLTDQQKKFVRDARNYGSKLTEEDYAKRLQLTGELRDE